MRKLYILCLIILCSFQVANARVDQYGRRHYKIALGVTNPLSAYTKYGGQFEERNRNVSYVFSYTKYTGAYPGYQMGAEMQFYMRTRSKHQYYMYLKGVLGDAGFDSRKLSIYGDQSGILIGNYDKDLKYLSGNAYGGGGLGFGRRYNYGVLFIRWNLGVKGCAIISDASKEEKNIYRLMFATGPASIIEFNVHMGLQL